MTLISSATRLVEQTPLPDFVTNLGVQFLVGRTRKRLELFPAQCARDFVRDMEGYPIAAHSDTANQQHYELPPEFFALALGPHRKYSCCLYPKGDETLAEAELLALRETAEHAALSDGQRILELGCGWGSLTLFMAEHYPNAKITAVSNSGSQRLHIETEAKARSLSNINVITADMNDFRPSGRFDRVVSVEMFEHMSNWPSLLKRISSSLASDGRVFIHVFSHRSQPYRFDHGDQADWIARHFFTGGVMPSHGLMAMFPDIFEVESDWRWSGLHYRRTALHWLANFDANRSRIDLILREVYGRDAALWRRRWRLFYLATAGLFGHASGNEWRVSHYRLRPA